MAQRRVRSVFFGSSDFSIPALRGLIEHHDVIAVCSQPDKPAGRGLALTPTPISVLARAAGIALLTPAKLDAAFAATLAELQPELLACASYGKLVPRTILQMESLRAALNVHPSLLPRYRGATPIQAALREGRDTTGVTIFWMVQALDAGDIAASRPVVIAPDDNYATLHDKLAAAGAELLLECVSQLLDGTLPRIPQNENEATYTKALTKRDLQLNCEQPALAVVNQIRSLSPRPAAWLPYQGRRLKILAAQVAPNGPAAGQPGVLFTVSGRTFVKTQPGSVEALRLILEGKPEMAGTQFAQRFEER